MGNGQVSMEFVVVLAALFMVLMFSVSAYSERNEGFIYAKEIFRANGLATELARGINNVWVAGEGASLEVPTKGLLADFNVSSEGNTIEVKWRGNLLDAPLATMNLDVFYTGEPGAFRITNTGNWVEVRGIE